MGAGEGVSRQRCFLPNPQPHDLSLIPEGGRRALTFKGCPLTSTLVLWAAYAYTHTPDLKKCIKKTNGFLYAYVCVRVHACGGQSHCQVSSSIVLHLTYFLIRFILYSFMFLCVCMLVHVCLYICTCASVHRSQKRMSDLAQSLTW